jgi:glucokinase
MNFTGDKRIVLTLDAGGTNLVFSAIQANQEIVTPLTLPSNADDLNKCIDTIIKGVNEISSKLISKPVALSLAFPGPIDHTKGIVGDLNNLPAFRGGIPLGPILQNRLNMPVFVNNDGNLFAYGEGLYGFLPFVNSLLQNEGRAKRYRNLIGITLGTGFGAGIIRNEELFAGDNFISAEVCLLRNRINPNTSSEEGISIRAIQRVYADKAKIDPSNIPSPKTIFAIANGQSEGNKDAALEAFRQLGVALGDALGNILTLIDGMVVIGGGISGAMSLIYPSLLEELNSKFISYHSYPYPRIIQKVFNLDDEKDTKLFLQNNEKLILVPETGEKITYSPEARVGIGTSKIGASKSISLGAYAYALKYLQP